MTVLLVTALICLPVELICVATLGVLTTNEESDLSLILTGDTVVGAFSGSSAFLLLEGKIVSLMSCKLLSAL